MPEAPTPPAPQPGTPAHDAAMVAKVDATAAAAQAAAAPTGTPAPAPAAAPQRPEGVPEKFWNAEKGEVNTEALLKSYAELERKGSTPPAADPPKAPTPGQNLGIPSDQQATQAVQNAGLDMAALQSEFVENGDLKPETYTKLEQAGIPKPMVDAYIAGQKALAAEYDSSIRQVAGGDAEYGKLVEWAKTAVTPAEAEAFNKAVTSGDKNMASLAVSGLKARMTAALGNPPATTVGGTAAPAGDVYESMAQVTADMKKPEYAKDPAFRAKVMAKLDRSDFGAIRTIGMT